MTTAIPDLWSDDIKVDVVPPIAILKAQEGLLARKTQGLLQAKLSTTEAENLVQHQLDLVAPSLNFYRERLLSATHDRVMLYPVTVTADYVGPKSEPLKGLAGAVGQLGKFQQQLASNLGLNHRKAATEKEFVELVRAVLQSAEVRALIHSLIARINQDKGQPQDNGNGGTVEQERSAEPPESEK